MGKIGFDNKKYVTLQSKRILERIEQFGGKLYLEFGGKLFDDYHASRVLPGFEPDSKVKMLLEMKDNAEIVIAINASDIEKNKVRGDLGITYDQDVLRLIDRSLCRQRRTHSIQWTNHSSSLRKQTSQLGSKGIQALQDRGLSIRHRENSQRRRIRQKRVYRNHKVARSRDRTRTRKRQNGNMSVTALPRA